MEIINPIFVLIVIGIIVFQIMFLWKIWDMTNDVREMSSDIREMKNFLLKDKSVTYAETASYESGWAEDVTDQEKIEASKLLYKIQPGQVIAKVLSNKRIEIWSNVFWEQEKDNSNYKLLFRK